jgi:hypothetical protein
MASTWGSVGHPTERPHRQVGDTNGAVTQPSEASQGAAPYHAVRYDATDSRHSREAGLSPWDSVDVNSGIASTTDFGKTGRFPDGPGAWRQT